MHRRSRHDWLIPLTHQRDAWSVTFFDRTGINLSFAPVCGTEQQWREPLRPYLPTVSSGAPAGEMAFVIAVARNHAFSWAVQESRHGLADRRDHRPQLPGLHAGQRWARSSSTRTRSWCRSHRISRPGEAGRFVACPVQMKAATTASFSLHCKYERIAQLLLVYVWHANDPDQACAYALRYDEAKSVADQMGWTRTDSWRRGGYSTNRPSEKFADAAGALPDGSWILAPQGAGGRDGQESVSGRFMAPASRRRTDPGWRSVARPLISPGRSGPYTLATGRPCGLLARRKKPFWQISS